MPKEKSGRVTVVARRSMHVWHLPGGKRDALKHLNECQYLHLKGVGDRLADFGRPNLIRDIPICRHTPELWSFEVRHGPLAGVAMRGWFAQVKGQPEIVVLGYERVQDDEEPRRYVILKMRYRLCYCNEVLGI